MNERIEELMFEAGRYADKNTGSSDRSGMWVYQYSEKFAELIVRECMTIVSNQTTLDTNEDFREGFNHSLKYAWTDIRKHFGLDKQTK